MSQDKTVLLQIKDLKIQGYTDETCLPTCFVMLLNVPFPSLSV